MIPLTAYAMMALSYARIELLVKDALYVRSTSGEDEQNVTTRKITAAVDPSGGRNLQIQFSGMISEGDIAILTEQPLFIDDNYAAGSRQKQSFVFYEGFNYRVVDVSAWRLQAGMSAYRASRHAVQDKV
jgi:hypothetical protein